MSFDFEEHSECFVSVCVFEMRSEESHSTFESERNDDNQVNHKPYDRNVK